MNKINNDNNNKDINKDNNDIKRIISESLLKTVLDFRKLKLNFDKLNKTKSNLKSNNMKKGNILNKVKERMLSTSFASNFLLFANDYTVVNELDIFNLFKNFFKGNNESDENIDNSKLNSDLKVFYKNKTWWLDCWIQKDLCINDGHDNQKNKEDVKSQKDRESTSANDDSYIFEFKFIRENDFSKEILSDTLRSICLMYVLNIKNSFVIYSKELGWVYSSEKNFNKTFFKLFDYKTPKISQFKSFCDIQTFFDKRWIENIKLNINNYDLVIGKSTIDEFDKIFNSNETINDNNVDLNRTLEELGKKLVTIMNLGRLSINNDFGETFNIIKIEFSKDLNNDEKYEKKLQQVIENTSVITYFKNNAFKLFDDKKYSNIRKMIDLLDTFKNKKNYDIILNNGFELFDAKNSKSKSKTKTLLHWNKIIRSNVIKNIFINKNKLNSSFIKILKDFVENKKYENIIKKFVDSNYSKELVFKEVIDAYSSLDNDLSTNNYENIQSNIIKFYDHINEMLKKNKKIKEENLKNNNNNNTLMNDGTTSETVHNKAKNTTLAFVLNTFLFHKIVEKDNINQNLILDYEKKIIDSFDSEILNTKIDHFFPNDQNEIDEYSLKNIYILYFYALIFEANDSIFKNNNKVSTNNKKVLFDILDLIKIFSYVEKTIDEKEFKYDSINFVYHLNKIKNLDYSDKKTKVLSYFLKNL